MNSLKFRRAVQPTIIKFPSEINQICDSLEIYAPSVPAQVLDWDKIDEPTKAILNNYTTEKWAKMFGDNILVKDLFEGETQRFFAKGEIFVNGVNGTYLFYATNLRILCSRNLFDAVNLPNYTDYQAYDNSYKPLKDVEILRQKLKEADDRLFQYLLTLTKAKIIAKYKEILNKIDAKIHVPTKDAQKEAQKQLINEAVSTFNGKLNDHLEKVRTKHEQIADNHNIDTVTKSEWDTTSVDKAKEIVKDFSAYLEANKDEIAALSIFYKQPYNRRNITFTMIKNVFEKLKLDKPTLAPDYVWAAYALLDKVRTGHVPSQPLRPLTTLVSLIRRACGIDSELKPFDKTIDDNFNKWIYTGKHNRFTPEQMEWLRELKEHAVNSYHIELKDLDYTPFDEKGGRFKMYLLFGAEMNDIINELNEVLTA